METTIALTGPIHPSFVTLRVDIVCLCVHFRCNYPHITPPRGEPWGRPLFRVELDGDYSIALRGSHPSFVTPRVYIVYLSDHCRCKYPHV